MDKSTNNLVVFLFGLIVAVSVVVVNNASGSVELVSSDLVAVSGGNRLTKLFDSGCDVAKKLDLQ